MGWFSQPEAVTYRTVEQKKATEEKEETAKAKSRLLETKGKNQGAEINPEQGRSVRRVFG